MAIPQQLAESWGKWDKAVSTITFGVLEAGKGNGGRAALSVGTVPFRQPKTFLCFWHCAPLCV